MSRSRAWTRGIAAVSLLGVAEGCITERHRLHTLASAMPTSTRSVRDTEPETAQPCLIINGNSCPEAGEFLPCLVSADRCALRAWAQWTVDRTPLRLTTGWSGPWNDKVPENAPATAAAQPQRYAAQTEPALSHIPSRR